MNGSTGSRGSALGLVDDVELAVGLHLADHHRLVQVVVALVHRQREAARRLEGLAVHRRADLVDLDGLGLLDRLLPHVDADVGGFHRIVGDDRVGVGHLVLGAQSRYILMNFSFSGFFTDMK
jgi:hypothetical protein